MNASQRDVYIIEKIFDYCNQICDTHKRFNNSFGTFSSDFVYRNAVCLCLLQIGELSNKLSDEFKNNNAKIPWRAIRGMRNMVAHEYGHIDVPTLWNTSQGNVVDLRQFCSDILMKR